jgi:Family of unknown function (DUF6011)
MNSEFRGQLIPAMRAQYILGGNATFTLVSSKTGQRFTYKLKQIIDKDGNKVQSWFVSVLIGPDNWTNYKYAGLLSRFDENSKLAFKSTKKSLISFDAPSIFAFRWLIDNLESPLLELWHEGSCGICGRKLTVPESIASGIGPICASR